MLHLAKAGIAAATEKAANMYAAFVLLYRMAVIKVKSIGAATGFGCAADCTPPVLFRQQRRIGTVFDAVSPPGVIVGMSLWVCFCPTLTALAVAGWVFVSASSDLRYGAWLAIILLAVTIFLVVAEALYRLRSLATWTPFLSFRRPPAGMSRVSRLAVFDLTFAAIAGKSARPFLTGIELGGRFDRLASGAKFFCHRSLLGRLLLEQKTLSLSTQGVL